MSVGSSIVLTVKRAFLRAQGYKADFDVGLFDPPYGFEDYHNPRTEESATIMCGKLGRGYPAIQYHSPEI